MLIRNENKFSKRNKSKRCSFEMHILRPDVIALLVKARNYLLMRDKLSKEAFLDLDAFGTLRDKRNCSCQFLHTIEEESDDSSEDAPYLELNSVVKEIYTDADVGQDSACDG